MPLISWRSLCSSLFSVNYTSILANFPILSNLMFCFFFVFLIFLCFPLLLNMFQHSPTCSNVFPCSPLFSICSKFPIFPHMFHIPPVSRIPSHFPNFPNCPIFSQFPTFQQAYPTTHQASQPENRSPCTGCHPLGRNWQVWNNKGYNMCHL